MCLIQRYECGAEIQKLSLDDCCRIDKSDVCKLRYLIVEVDWDGREEEKEEEYDYDPNVSFFNLSVLGLLKMLILSTSLFLAVVCW